MSKLPLEILNKIFIQLNLQQRLICLLVCRSWWRVLDGGTLFYSVEVKDGENNFGHKMDMFEELPDRATQVEELHIVLQTDTLFNRRTLFNTFPNARVMKVETEWASIFSNFSHVTAPFDTITNSKSKVESLSDIGHCDLVLQMVYSNLGSRLKTLNLNLYSVTDTPAILSQLKNLPVLKELSLKSPQFNLYHLENLHKNIPSIQDFVLEDIAILESSMPFNITPATCITKFKFHLGTFESVEAYARFYQYTTRKYTNITDIDYKDENLLNYDDNERKYIYLNGLLDFFKLIGPYQSKLLLYGLPDDVDLFRALDVVDSHITKLNFWKCEGETLFQRLSRSNQYKHIGELCIINTRIDSIHLIKGMPALTTLVLHFIDSRFLPVNLTDCLAACPPSLKNLVITCKSLAVEPFNTILDSIEDLYIGFKTITSDIGDIISYCFPNLVKLKLTGEVRENVDITLKNPYFLDATLSTSGARKLRYCTHGFSFKSPNYTETQYYICQEGENTRVQREDIQDLPMLSVVSLTEKELVLNKDIEVIPSSLLLNDIEY
ncbi:hypothetical protein K501DRAFT_309364 [Backusella circina FSU 941]|nr:hypothetical protein K501DRAFT_309364 [Backusella circina FSU 941]